MAAAMKIGLALGSGGARGLAHAGVLEVLEQAGVRLDCIAGTSMGAIVGGLYAEYPQAAVTWKRLYHYVTNQDFVSSWSAFVAKESSGEESQPPRRFQDMLDFVHRKMIALKTVTRPYLQEADRLRKPLENLFQVRSFEQLKIPFAAVAVDLISGRKVVFTQGSLIDGVYASSAIPAVFPPLERDGMMICDGGGPYRTPVDICQEMGATFLIAVDIPAFEQQKFTTGLEIIMRNNTIARQRLNDLVLEKADIVIRPDVHDFHWADFKAGEACRERGRDAALAVLPQLQEKLERQRQWSFRMRRQLASLLCAVTDRG
jgi:NTE family protein